MNEPFSSLLESLPDDCLYSPQTDMWVRPTDDGLLDAGATHIVGAHGDFLLFNPRPDGYVADRDRSLGMMETGKTIIAIHAPISCEVVQSNAAVRADAGLVNRSPYGAGWLYRLRATAWEAERALLLDRARYREWLGPRLAARLAPSGDEREDPMRWA